MEFVRDSQKGHVEVILKILRQYGVAIDTSKMGLGKTWLSRVIQKELGVPGLVLAPKAVTAKHQDLIKKMEGQSADLNPPIFTSEALAGKKGCKMSHNWLTRKDADGKLKENQVAFTLTPELEAAIAQGMLLVIDESHKVMNANALAYHAVKAITRAIHQHNREHPENKSYILMLSATPFSKPEYCTALCEFFGTYQAPHLYEIIPFEPIELTGYEELITLVTRLDPKFRVEHYPYQAKQVREEVTRMTNQVLKKHFSHHMKEEFKAHMEVENIILSQMSEHDQQELREAVKQLEAAKKSGSGTTVISQITATMKRIHQAKIAGVAAMIHQMAEKEENRKFVIAMTFRDHMRQMEILLSDLGALSYHGDLKMPQRKDYLEKFAKPDTDYRVMIVQQTTGALGIDLDDKDGNFPRTMVVFPVYQFISSIQITGRCLREDTASDLTIMMVYGQDHDGTELSLKHSLEMSIQTSLANKNGSLCQFTDAQQTFTTVY